jgi:YD repeat-containing protein
MTYDGLDRLTSDRLADVRRHVAYSYDVFDNIETQVGPDRNLRYCYDGANRLAFVRADATDCSTGAATTSLGFDVQGNLRFKNAQAHAFSQDNRLRSVPGKEAYRYDAHGRRVTSEHAALGTIRSFYGRTARWSSRSTAERDRTAPTSTWPARWSRRVSSRARAARPC